MKLFNPQSPIEPPSDPQPPIEMLSFQPLPGFSSPHAQTVLAYLTPAGSPPPSISHTIPLSDGCSLCCEVSTPPQWVETNKSVILVHGLGGSHESSYMIRMSRKLYKEGIRAVRVNMRCSGSGGGPVNIPYHGGLSNDILAVVHYLKKQTPHSPLFLVGFSLGGNIVLKLAAELGPAGPELIQTVIAICPPVDLAETAAIMSQPSNRLYNRYYMHQLEAITNTGKSARSFSTIYEFDSLVTVPNWGFSTPEEYYRQSSSRYMLSMIQVPCHILLSIDDPFINHLSCLNVPRSSSVNIWLSEHGGHVGFFGWVDEEHRYYWLDSLLLKWLKTGV
ncbi:MAG: alpha/beta fold hydrolase [Parachlamydiaceae bacterium]